MTKDGKFAVEDVKFLLYGDESDTQKVRDFVSNFGQKLGETLRKHESEKEEAVLFVFTLFSLFSPELLDEEIVSAFIGTVNKKLKRIFTPAAYKLLNETLKKEFNEFDKE